MFMSSLIVLSNIVSDIKQDLIVEVYVCKIDALSHLKGSTSCITMFKFLECANG